MKFFKNFLIVIAVLILTYYTAQYFGALYDKFSPQYDGSFLGVSKSWAVFIAGLPVAYVFFVPFLFEIFGSKSRRKWIIGLLIPAVLLWIAADPYYIYVPAVLGLVAFFMAYLIRLFVSKFRHPNPPMVIK